MEARFKERYWSFTFWLRKSIWLGLTSLSVWMLWQFIFRDVQIAQESVFFTNTIWRIIGGAVFAYFAYYFGIRLFKNWEKDAVYERPFTPVLDEASEPNRMVDEPVIQHNRTLASPPPFAPADDLTKIEGIGPAIANVLRNDGIVTFSDLASKTVEELEDTLSRAGENFRFQNPSEWPTQAQMIVDNQWEALEEFQSDSRKGK